MFLVAQDLNLMTQNGLQITVWKTFVFSQKNPIWLINTAIEVLENT